MDNSNMAGAILAGHAAETERSVRLEPKRWAK
jgi:hypothetical protein